MLFSYSLCKGQAAQTSNMAVVLKRFPRFRRRNETAFNRMEWLWGIYCRCFHPASLPSAKLPIVHHEQYSCAWPTQHRFKMVKFLKVLEWLVKDSVIKLEQVFKPGIASYQTITAVHSTEYVDCFFDGSISQPEMRQTGFHWTEGLVNRCRMEVGGTLLAAQLALKYGLACSTGGGTHHAFPSHGSGFCMLNDLAITSRHLVDNKLAEKVLIVDLDVHQGDGTAFIFKNNPCIFTFSMHCEKNFPLRKETSDLDVPLRDGVSDTEYLETLVSHLPFLLDSFRPDIVLYDAGIDPHKDDALGKLNLSDQGLFDRDVTVLEMALQRGIPCATVIGGGYDDDVEILGRRHTLIHRAATKVWNEKKP